MTFIPIRPPGYVHPKDHVCAQCQAAITFWDSCERCGRQLCRHHCISGFCADTVCFACARPEDWEWWTRMPEKLRWEIDDPPVPLAYPPPTLADRFFDGLERLADHVEAGLRWLKTRCGGSPGGGAFGKALEPEKSDPTPPPCSKR